MTLYVNRNTSLISALETATTNLETSVRMNTLLIENLDTELDSLKLRVEEIEKVIQELSELKQRVSSIESEMASDDIKQLAMEARLLELESLDTNTKEKKEKKEKENKGKSEDAPGQNK